MALRQVVLDLLQVALNARREDHNTREPQKLRARSSRTIARVHLGHLPCSCAASGLRRAWHLSAARVRRPDQQGEGGGHGVPARYVQGTRNTF
jgi:hypothetical protein